MKRKGKRKGKGTEGGEILTPREQMKSRWYARRNGDEVLDDFPVFRLSNLTWTWTFRKRDHVTEAFCFSTCTCTHTAVEKRRHYSSIERGW